MASYMLPSNGPEKHLTCPEEVLSVALKALFGTQITTSKPVSDPKTMQDIKAGTLFTYNVTDGTVVPFVGQGNQPIAGIAVGAQSNGTVGVVSEDAISTNIATPDKLKEVLTVSAIDDMRKRVQAIGFDVGDMSARELVDFVMLTFLE